MRAPHWTRLMSNSVIRFHLPWLDCAGGALSTRRPQLCAGASSRRFSPERGSKLIHRSPIQRAADRVLRGKVAAQTLVSKGLLPTESGSPQGRSRLLPVAIVEPATTPVCGRDRTRRSPRELGVVRRPRAGFVKRQRTVWAYPS